MTPVYAIADREQCATLAEWLELLALLAGGGAALQVRAKRSSSQERALGVAWARKAGARAPVLLNGTTREARAAGADGVHWPEALIPEGRDGETLAAIASVHSLAAARRAVAAGASRLVFGPVFAPGSKPGTGVGLAALAELSAAVPVPVLAVGGITPERVAACRAAGAQGVAVVSGVLRARDPLAALESYFAAWSAAPAEVQTCR